jgi:hypothetical protein
MISALLWSGLSDREKVGFLLVELLVPGMGRSQLKRMSSLSMFSLSCLAWLLEGFPDVVLPHEVQEGLVLNPLCLLIFLFVQHLDLILVPLIEDNDICSRHVCLLLDTLLSFFEILVLTLRILLSLRILLLYLLLLLPLLLLFHVLFSSSLF